MKLSNRQPSRESAKVDLSMTSMIDVVFLLLIFFLVTATVVLPERQMVADIQNQSFSGTQSQRDLQPAVIQIVQQGGRILFQLGAIETAELKDLRIPLQGFENKREGAFVYVSNGVPFEKVAQVIDLCKTEGFQSVAYVPGD